MTDGRRTSSALRLRQGSLLMSTLCLVACSMHVGLGDAPAEGSLDPSNTGGSPAGGKSSSSDPGEGGDGSSNVGSGGASGPSASSGGSTGSTGSSNGGAGAEAGSGDGGDDGGAGEAGGGSAGSGGGGGAGSSSGGSAGSSGSGGTAGSGGSAGSSGSGGTAGSGGSAGSSGSGGTAGSGGSAGSSGSGGTGGGDPVCGNGVTEEDEDCDDQNENPIDGCDACGDSAVGPFWSKSFKVSNSFNYPAVAVDHDGNIVVAGGFYQTVDFGKGNLTSAGSYDVYLAKFDVTGALLWNKRFGSGPYYADNARAVTIDPDGNIIIVGEYTSQPVDFGGGLIMDPGHPSAFVAKYDPDGNHLFSVGGENNAHAWGVATDDDGNVLVAGVTTGFPGLGCTGPNVFGDHPFLAKLQPDGTCEFVREYPSAAIGLGGSGYGSAHTVAADADGNIFLTGELTGSINFGSGMTSYYGETFLLKLDQGGNVVWDKHLGQGKPLSSNANGSDLGVAPDGSVVLSARCQSGVDYGSGTLIQYGALAKYDNDGVHLWSNSLGGGYFGMDAYGDVVVNPTGAFFGDGTLRRVQANGVQLWSRTIGTQSSFPNSAPAIDDTGAVIVAGLYTGALDFGVAGSQSATGDQQTNLFLARMPP